MSYGTQHVKIVGGTFFIGLLLFWSACNLARIRMDVNAIRTQMEQPAQGEGDK